MPSKNKPKRFDRQRNSRVARRKRRRELLVTGKKRSRGVRPKQKVSTSLLNASTPAKQTAKPQKKEEKKVVEKKSEAPTKDAVSHDEK